MSCVTLCGYTVCYKRRGDVLDYETLVNIFNILACNEEEIVNYAVLNGVVG